MGHRCGEWACGYHQAGGSRGSTCGGETPRPESKPRSSVISTPRTSEAAPSMDPAPLHRPATLRAQGLGSASPLAAERRRHPASARRIVEPPPTRCGQRRPRVFASAAGLWVPSAPSVVCLYLPWVSQVVPALGPPEPPLSLSLRLRALRNTAGATAAYDVSKVCFPGP